MDNDVFHDNTQYARELDEIQEQERHKYRTLVSIENESFAARCRRAHISVKKLKMCEREIREATSPIHHDIADLKIRLANANSRTPEKHLKKWRREFDEKRKEINRITESVSRKYFPK